MAKKTKLPKDLKGVKFTTPVGRLSFPNLFEAKQFMEDGKPKGDPVYSATLLFSKDMDLSEMKSSINKAAREAWGKKADGGWPKNLRMPWRDGDEYIEENPDKNTEGYENTMYVNAKSKRKPVVINRGKERIEDADASEVYGGCYGRMVLVAKATEVGGNYFVSLYLQGFQKTKDGQPFGGGVNIDEDFDDLEDDEDDDGDDDSDDMGF